MFANYVLEQRRIHRCTAAWRHAAVPTVASFDWLDRAYAERNPGLIYLNRAPALAPLRAHPRFKRIARAMKLAD